ncbi:MAG: RNA polymerase sigma-I factor [Bacillota bacterium]
MIKIFLTFDDAKAAVLNLVMEAQNGNTGAREKLIADHQLFVKKIVSKKLTGYEDINSRDEYSVGLIAFNEAIDGYKPGLRSFQSFAASVINKRLIDYYRSQNKHRARTLYAVDDSGFLSSVQDPCNTIDRVYVKLEMESFVSSLSQYKITLWDLINETPKHADSRALCLRIAKIITSDPDLCRHLQKYRSIPLKMLLKKIKLNEKTIERHRKYIISICLVLLSGLDTMKEYVESLIKGGDHDAE